MSVEYDYKGVTGARRVAGDIDMRSPADMNYKFDITYDQKSSQKTHTVTYEHKHLIKMIPKQCKLASMSKITSSLYPAANYAYDFSYDRNHERIELKVFL